MPFIGQTYSPRDINPANSVIRDVICDPSVYIGSAVRIENEVAYNAIADSYNNSNVIGIVEEKLTSTTCVIRFLGTTPDIFTGLDEVEEYYLSDITPGLITTVIPSASGHVVLKIGQPFSETKFLVQKGVRMVRS